MTAHAKPPRLLSGLSEVAGEYDAVLCDVWGVLHNGRKAFTGAVEALTGFREGGKPVVLITNAPVPKARVVRFFEPLGISEAAWDDCISSGDATRDYLEQQRDARIHVLGAEGGWEHDRFLTEGLNADFTGPDEAGLVLCVGLRDQENDHPEDYREELRPLAARGLPMVCANPDHQVRIGDTLHWCAGAIAAVYEELGGPVIYPGKPHAPIYEAAHRALERITGAPTPPPERVLCIGDSPATDLKGAEAQGHHSLYTGTGLAEHEGEAASGEAFLEELQGLLDGHGASATYAMPALSWR